MHPLVAIVLSALRALPQLADIYRHHRDRRAAQARQQQEDAICADPERTMADRFGQPSGRVRIEPDHPERVPPERPKP